MKKNMEPLFKIPHLLLPFLLVSVLTYGCTKNETKSFSQPITEDSKLDGSYERKATNKKGEVHVEIWAWDRVKDFSAVDDKRIPESAEVAVKKFGMTLKYREFNEKNNKEYPVGVISRAVVVDSEEEVDYFEKESGSDIFYLKTRNPDFGILGVRYVGRGIREIFSDMKIAIPPSEMNATYYLFGRNCSYILTVNEGMCKQFAMSSEM